MATLNKTEKLICNAAKSKSPFETKVFNSFLEYYEAYEYHFNETMHVKLIIYLYCGKHKGETFDCIARNFNRSVSTLEENRKNYQKMFTYFYDKLLKANSAA